MNSRRPLLPLLAASLLALCACQEVPGPREQPDPNAQGMIYGNEPKPEPIPQKNGRSLADGQCHALAMSLEPGGRRGPGLRLELRSVLAGRGAPGADTHAEPASLLSLGAALERHRAAPADGALWRLDLGWGAELSLVSKLSS